MSDSLLLKALGFFILSFPFLAHSAGSEFSAQAIFIQAFNFSVFLFAFLYLVRKPLQTLFHKRQKDFFAFEEQALKLEKEKQAEQKLWDKKLSELEKTEKNIQKQAQEEGERFKKQKQKELEDLAQNLKKSSSFFLNLETEKLKRKSFSYWKSRLLADTKSELKQLALSKDFQKKEHAGFISLLKKQELREKGGEKL